MAASADTTPVAPLPESATLILHPLTHEVFRVPDDALVIDKRVPVRLTPTQFERALNGGPLRAERIYRVRNNQDLVNNNDTVEPDEIVVVRLRSSENVPTAYTWGLRFALAHQFPGQTTAVRAKHWLDSSPPAGHRFLFLWNPARAHNCAVARRHRIYSEGLSEYDFDDPLLSPTLAYNPKLGGTGVPLGPDDIDGCTPIGGDVRLLRPEERMFVASIPPLAMLSGVGSAPMDSEWSDKYAESFMRRQAEFLASERDEPHLPPRKRRASEPPTKEPSARERAQSQYDSLSSRFETLQAQWQGSLLGLPINAPMETRVYAAALSSVTPPPSSDFAARARALRRVEADVVDALGGQGGLSVARARARARAHKRDGRVPRPPSPPPAAATFDQLITLKAREVWKQLPAELLVKVLGHMLGSSLEHDLSSDAAASYATVRSLCRDGRQLADGLLRGQLARLRDSVDQLSGSILQSDDTVVATTKRCFPLRTMTVAQATEMPDPVQLSARVHGLGITCNDAFEAMLTDVDPEHCDPALSGNQWPLSAYGFTAAPSARGYFRVRRRHETKTRSRDGVMSEPSRPKWLRYRVTERRVDVAARLLGELQDINPNMHMLLTKGEDDQIKQLTRSHLRAASAPAAHAHTEAQLLADARVG